MAFDELRQRAREVLIELAQGIWPEEAPGTLARQADDLKAHIRKAYDELLRQRRLLQTVQQRVEAQERQAATLPWQVDACLQVGNKPDAWRAAMELDRVRAMLDQDRARVRELQEEQRQRLDSLEHDRQRLGDLQRQLRGIEAHYRTA